MIEKKKDGNWEKETEGLIIADQVLQTKNMREHGYENTGMSMRERRKCSGSELRDETTAHIATACPSGLLGSI